MPKLNALVAGSTGYIGVQLIKLLIKHKFINIRFLCGNSSVGKNISSYDKSLSGKKLPKIIKFNKKLLKDVDVVFTALPNGEAQDISKHLTKNNTLIDLAADFRLEKASEYLKCYKQKHRATHLINKSLYSLPEINGKSSKKHQIISGASVCFNNKQIWSHQQTSTIHMNTLNQKQINTYLKKTGEDILSSVGCYQVEKLGPQIIKSINGDFFNVLGFPLFPFLTFLSKI